MSKLDRVRIPVNVEITVDDFVSGWGMVHWDSAYALVKKIDVLIADAGFTETLVKEMMASLRLDLNDGEWDRLIIELDQVKPKSYE